MQIPGGRVFQKDRAINRSTLKRKYVSCMQGATRKPIQYSWITWAAERVINEVRKMWCKADHIRSYKQFSELGFYFE